MAGRKVKFDVDLLKSIINEYFTKNKVFGQITAKSLADFAIKEFDYHDIRYYHFTRKQEIKELIAEINNARLKVEKQDVHTIVEFNVDKLFKNFSNNEVVLKSHLKHFASRYDELNRIALDDRNKIEDLTAKLETEIVKNKSLKEEFSKLKALKIANNRLNLLSDELEMREFLNRKGLTILNEDNIRIMMAHCGFNVNGVETFDSEEDFPSDPPIRLSREDEEAYIELLDNIEADEEKRVEDNVILADFLNDFK